MGIRRDRSHEACSLIEIQFFFLHKCICSQRMIASICLRSRVLNVLIFMIFASVLIPLWRSVSFFFFWPCCTCRILVPQPGIKSVPAAVEAQSLNLWTTREASCRSGFLEVLILPFQKCFSCGVHGICFDLIDSLPFETLPVMVRTT